MNTANIARLTIAFTLPILATLYHSDWFAAMKRKHRRVKMAEDILEQVKM